jgi:hypothetical protein
MAAAQSTSAAGSTTFFHDAAWPPALGRSTDNVVDKRDHAPPAAPPSSAM